MTRIMKALGAKRDELGKKEGGFTLIELLVVVIIIGILAAIAIPVYLNIQQGAWRSSVESDLGNIAISLQAASTQNNGSFDGLFIDGVAAGTHTVAAGSADITDGAAGPLVGTFTVSPGNSVAITIAAGQYTLVGTNTDLGTPSVTYSSATGGLGDWTS